MWGRLRQAATAANRAGGGLWFDLSLYLLSACFAWVTASSSTLLPHRAWGSIAVVGYATAGVISAAQLLIRAASTRTAPRSRRLGLWSGTGARTALAVCAWAATALLPLIIQAVQRANGRTDRAQEEVLVIEDGGRRLLETGTPYLDRAAIAGLAPDDRLLGYLPYQPGMAAFGVPRALDPSAAWWSDARVWIALVTGLCLAAALVALRRAGAPPPALVRALQAATVLPICALTLATGGNDLAVLGLCLLALALAATGRSTARATRRRTGIEGSTAGEPSGTAAAGPPGTGLFDWGSTGLFGWTGTGLFSRAGSGLFGWAGIVVGTAASLKLFAWPVAVGLGVYAITRGRSNGWRYAAGALGIPILTALPILIIGPGALIENVVAFPFGRGLVTSPAASPLPGHLIATMLPGGGAVAIGLLAVAGAVTAVFAIRRPPSSAAAASAFAGCALLVAFLLLPATRFGYLLYPAVLLTWVPALRVPAGVPASVPATGVPAINGPGTGPTGPAAAAITESHTVPKPERQSPTRD